MKKIFLICFLIFLSSNKYQSFSLFRDDMQQKVKKMTDAIQQIYQTKCNNTIFTCPVLTYDMCEGTGPRVCMSNFPRTSCVGTNKFSNISVLKKANFPLSSQITDDHKFFICKSAEPSFQNVLQEITNTNSGAYAWHYFGSNEGSFRISPGRKFQKLANFMQCADYDPRLRPWYSQNLYKAKNVVILLQNSLYMSQLKKDKIFKYIVGALVRTSSPQDQLNIIQFSEKADSIISANDSKLFQLSKLRDKYKNSSINFQEAVINNISITSSYITNYSLALSLAFQIINNSKNPYNGYQNILILISGSEPKNEEMDKVYQLLQRKRNQIVYHFFGFGISMTKVGSQFFQNISCLLDGLYIEINNTISSESQFLNQAKGYYQYLLQGNQDEGFKWTDIYEDQLQLGNMTTLLKPVFYNQSGIKRLIGVAGLDILLSQILQYMNQSTFRSMFIQKTPTPFKKYINSCYLQSLRAKKCNKNLAQSNCGNFCQVKMKYASASVFQSARDNSNQTCCVFSQVKESNNSAIIGLSITIGILLIIIVILGGYIIYQRIGRKQEQQSQPNSNYISQVASAGGQNDSTKTNVRQSPIIIHLPPSSTQSINRATLREQNNI